MTAIPNSAVKSFADKWMPEPNTGCWLWLAYTDPKGYGWITFGGKHHAAHRVSWTLHRGPIPAGLQIDHLCRCTSCVNPDHLEPVTPAENLARADGAGVRNSRKTHCPNGHLLDTDNLCVSDLRLGQRRCKVCRNAMAAARQRRRYAEGYRVPARKWKHAT